MQAHFLAARSLPPALCTHLQLQLNARATLQPEDYTVAVAACGCASVRRRGKLTGCKGKDKGLQLEIKKGFDPSSVITCPLCDKASVSKDTKIIAAHIKGHVEADDGVEWLCVAELPLQVREGGGVKRADLVFIPKHATSLSSAVAVEIDPALHFENPGRWRVPCRRGTSMQDSARDAALKGDEDKDTLYKELGMYLLCVAGDALVQGCTPSATILGLVVRSLACLGTICNTEMRSDHVFSLHRFNDVQLWQATRRSHT